MISIYIRLILTLVSSIARRGKHGPLFLSLLTPIILIVISSSIPSISHYAILTAEPGRLERLTVAIESISSNNCTPVVLGELYIDDVNVFALGVDSYDRLAKEFNSVLDLRSTGCILGQGPDQGVIVSIPRHRMNITREKCTVDIITGNSTIKGYIVSTHDVLDAVIVNTTVVNGTTKYLCLARPSRYVHNMLEMIDKNIDSFINGLYYFLLSIFLLTSFIAFYKVIDSMHSELKAIHALGLSKREVAVCMSFALIVISTALFIVISFLATITVFASYYLLSIVAPTIPPLVDLHEILVKLAPFYSMTAIVSFVSSWRRIHEAL